MFKGGSCSFALIKTIKLKINKESKFQYRLNKLCHIKTLRFYVAIKHATIGRNTTIGKDLSLNEICIQHVMTMASFFYIYKVTSYKSKCDEIYFLSASL